jgi:hypothetical protein
MWRKRKSSLSADFPDSLKTETDGCGLRADYMQIGEALWREKEISRSMPAMEFHGFLEWIRHEAAAGGGHARERGE